MKEYVNMDIHTNTIENFWSHLKRVILGIYHWVSSEHLQAYVDEFSFRFNTRNLDSGKRFNFVLKNSEGRLKYQELKRMSNKDLIKDFLSEIDEIRKVEVEGEQYFSIKDFIRLTANEPNLLETFERLSKKFRKEKSESREKLSSFNELLKRIARVPKPDMKR